MIPPANLGLVFRYREHLLNASLVVFAKNLHRWSRSNPKLTHISLSVGRTKDETHSPYQLMMNQIHSKRIDQNIEFVTCTSRLLRFPTAMPDQVHVLDLVAPIIHKPFIEKHRVFVILDEQVRLLEAIWEASHLRHNPRRTQAEPSIVHVSLRFDSLNQCYVRDRLWFLQQTTAFGKAGAELHFILREELGALLRTRQDRRAAR